MKQNRSIHRYIYTCTYMFLQITPRFEYVIILRSVYYISMAHILICTENNCLDIQKVINRLKVNITNNTCTF